MTTRTERTEPNVQRCGSGIEAAQLSAYLDGELSPSQSGRLEEHLASCTHCAGLLAELGAVVDRAASMKREAEPASDLWPGIRSRLEPRRRRWSWIPAAARGAVAGLGPAWRPAFAAVAVLVLLGVAAGWLLRINPGPAPEAGVANVRPPASNELEASPEYYDTLATLRSSARARLTHDPKVVEVLEANLEVLDVAIAQYADALAAEPGDKRLVERLEAARRRKIELLEHAVSLSSEADN